VETLDFDLLADAPNHGKGDFFHFDCKQSPLVQPSTASAGIIADPSATAKGKSKPIDTPLLEHPLLISFIAAPDSLADAIKPEWNDLTDYEQMTASSVGTMEDSNKDMIIPKDAGVEIGRMKIARYGSRDYSYEGKKDGQSRLQVSLSLPKSRQC
jgi:hypothetical protein